MGTWAAAGVLVVAAGCFACRHHQSGAPAATTAGPVPAPPFAAGILVLKADRQLIWYRGGRVVRRIRVALGPRPIGAKGRRGDGKTPEGCYRICARNPRSRFHLSLQLDYPNLSDADRGIRAGHITRAQREAIARAARSHQTPPQHTLLGGDIFIHGGGADRDWTAGCVAVANADIEALYAGAPVGTPVEIRP